MPTYAVHYTYTDETERRMAVRPAHREFLGGLADQGHVLAAGAYAPHEAPGALLVCRHESAAALEEALQQDPYATEGLLVERRVVEWAPAIGQYAAELG